jgi:hypothetical protein
MWDMCVCGAAVQPVLRRPPQKLAATAQAVSRDESDDDDDNDTVTNVSGFD